VTVSSLQSHWPHARLRYDSDIRIPDNIESENDRVEFITNVTQVRHERAVAHVGRLLAGLTLSTHTCGRL
jgi:hypothetical protein